jgi:prevent-host-death family protein
LSSFVVRTQLGQIMRRARLEHTRFVVDRRGEPQVVIMDIEDFLSTIAPEKKVLAAIRAEAREKGKDKLSLREINQEIRSYRRERSCYSGGQLEKHGQKLAYPFGCQYVGR